MTVVLEGVTMLDLLRGNCSFDHTPAKLVTSEEWLALIGDAMKGSLGDVGRMYSIKELFQNMVEGRSDMRIELSEQSLFFAQTGLVPHGARFLECGRLAMSGGDGGKDRLETTLLIGKSYTPGPVRPWTFYSLQYTMRDEGVGLSGAYTHRIFSVLDISLSVLLDAELTTAYPDFRLGNVLTCIHEALGDSIRRANDRARDIGWRRNRLDAVFHRLGWSSSR